MATHSSVLAWRIPGIGEPGGLPSTGSHRVGYDWSDLAAHTSKVMLKILQARLQQYLNRELLDVQAGFRKGRGTRDQIANIRWIIEKARELQKPSISALLTMPKPLTVWITINWKILQAWILEHVAICFSRGSFWPKDWTHVSCLAGRFFTTELPGMPSQ